MGAFLDTLLVKGAKPQRIAEILREQFPAMCAFLPRRVKRWANVFLDWKGQALGAYDLVQVGRAVCAACVCPGIAFRVVDSDLFYWWVFSETGTVVTQSCREEAYDDPSEDEQVGLGGDLDAIARLGAKAGVTVAQVRHAIQVASPGMLEHAVQNLTRLLGAEFGCTSYDDIVAESQRDVALGYDALKTDWIYVGPGSPLTQTGATLRSQADSVRVGAMPPTATGAPILGVGPLTDAATGCPTMLVISRVGRDVTFTVWRNPGGVTLLSLDPQSVRNLIDALQVGTGPTEPVAEHGQEPDTPEEQGTSAVPDVRSEMLQGLPSAAELRELLQAWPFLPAAVRAGVVALVRTTVSTSNAPGRGPAS